VTRKRARACAYVAAADGEDDDDNDDDDDDLMMMMMIDDDDDDVMTMIQSIQFHPFAKLRREFSRAVSFLFKIKSTCCTLVAMVVRAVGLLLLGVILL